MRVSIVIPLHGGTEEIRACLRSLEECRDAWDEVIVVDDASPDEAVEVAESFAWARVVRLPQNRGFAAACNRGFHESTGDAVIFLNSDTVVPPPAIPKMIEAFAQEDVAASGPYSNSTINVQLIDVPYAQLEDMPQFAEEFASRDLEHVEVDFLVGFCLALRRSALDGLGEPFDERFGIGTYEDNDLSYRLRREGLRLLVAAGAFVHHSGSATFSRENIAMRELLARNEQAFLAKWRDDISTGFASHLSGFGRERIVFQPERKPEDVLARLRELARTADISLCMIVKNGALTLPTALRHADDYFTQVVVIDTGSEDASRAIAQGAGAEVHEFPWEDDFSAARNESIRYARGKWILWLDADESISLASAETLLQDVVAARPQVGGLLVANQSLDPNGFKTLRVDQVKVFRNRPDLHFEGRIHEQILPSIERAGLSVSRSDAVVIHTGYGGDAQNQSEKLARDWQILTQELQERPNHPFVLFNAAMVARFSNRHEEALEFARRAIEETELRGAHPIRKADVVRVEALRGLGRDDEALRAALEGLKRVGDDPELHFYAGSLLSLQGRFPEALSHFMAVEGDPTPDFTSIDVSMLTYRLWHNIGSVNLRLGRYQEARTWLSRAIESSPDPTPSAQLLFMAGLQARDFQTCQDMLNAIEKSRGMTETWSLLFMRLQDVTKGSGSGERALRKLARAHGEEVGPRLAICKAMISTGRAPEALRDLAIMAEAGVPDAAFYLSAQAESEGDLDAALAWMERACELNPDHALAKKERKRLEEAGTPHRVSPKGG